MSSRLFKRIGVLIGMVVVCAPLWAQEESIIYEFSDTSAEENGLMILGAGFDSYPEADVSFGQIPIDNAFKGATDGYGAMIVADPGEGVMINPSIVESERMAFIRCSVRTNAAHASVYLASIDQGENTFVSTLTPNNGAYFLNRYRRLSDFFLPPSTGFQPIIQVLNTSETEPLTVYLDNLEIFLLESGRFYNTDFLNGTENDPAIQSFHYDEIKEYLPTPTATFTPTPTNSPTLAFTNTPTSTPTPVPQDTVTPTPTIVSTDETLLFKEDFSNPSLNDFTLVGDAYVDQNSADLILTKSQDSQLGALVLNHLIQPDDIRISFDFQVQRPGGLGNGADGMAVLCFESENIQRDTRLITTSGGTFGMPQKSGFMVEIDTFNNQPYNHPYGDQDANHIAVNLNGDLSKPVAYTSDIPNFKRGGQFRIDIVISSGSLEVYLTNESYGMNHQRILTASVHDVVSQNCLFAIVGTTGAGWELHRVDNFKIERIVPSTPTPTPTLVPIIADHVRVIDDNPDIILGEVDGNEYVFTYTGSGQPNLQSGDILVGTENGGYLRKVVNVTLDGQQMHVETEKASLAEAVEQGSLSVNLTDIDWTIPQSTLQRKGVVPQMVVSTLSQDLSNTTLFKDDNIWIEITEGMIEFDPDLLLELEIKDQKTNFFKIEVIGDLELDYTFRLAVGDQVDLEKSITIFESHHIKNLQLGHVPVIMQITFSILGGIDVNIGSTVEVQTGFHTNVVAGLGAEWIHQSWNPILSLTNTFNPYPPDWSDSHADVEAMCYLRPQLAIKFYGVAGPMLALKPYAQLSGKVTLHPSYSWELKTGVDGIIGIDLLDLEIIDESIPPLEMSYPLWEKVLLSDTIELPSTPEPTLSSTPTPSPTPTQANIPQKGLLEENSVIMFAPYYMSNKDPFDYLGDKAIGGIALELMWPDDLGQGKLFLTDNDLPALPANLSLAESEDSFHLGNILTEAHKRGTKVYAWMHCFAAIQGGPVGLGRESNGWELDPIHTLFLKNTAAYLADLGVDGVIVDNLRYENESGSSEDSNKWENITSFTGEVLHEVWDVRGKRLGACVITFNSANDAKYYNGQDYHGLSFAANMLMPMIYHFPCNPYAGPYPLCDCGDDHTPIPDYVGVKLGQVLDSNLSSDCMVVPILQTYGVTDSCDAYGDLAYPGRDELEPAIESAKSLLEGDRNLYGQKYAFFDLDSTGQEEWESILGSTNNFPVEPLETITVNLPDLPSGAKPLELVRIPHGTFTMGSPSNEKDRGSDEGPQHQVTLTRDFYMGKYEVTVSQYAAFLEATGSESGVDWSDSDCPLTRSGGNYNLRNNTYGKSWDQPMVEVSWYGAVLFCNYLSQKEGLQIVYNENNWDMNENANGYRLPTEAEWEYACRAGTTSRFYWGDDLNYTEIDDYAWYWGNSSSGTKEVGLKLPNDFGLYDMSGNVWEWCTDWYDDDYYSRSPAQNPVNIQSNQYRVLRGGYWDNGAWSCRSAYRGWYYPNDTSNNFGFRVTRTP